MKSRRLKFLSHEAIGIAKDMLKSKPRSASYLVNNSKIMTMIDSTDANLLMKEHLRKKNWKFLSEKRTKDISHIKDTVQKDSSISPSLSSKIKRPLSKDSLFLKRLLYPKSYESSVINDGPYTSRETRSIIKEIESADNMSLGHPAGRQDAENLQSWYNSMKKKYLLKENNRKDAESIFEICLKEIIRQVTVQCIQRGQLLKEVTEDMTHHYLHTIKHIKNKHEILKNSTKRDMDEFKSKLNQKLTVCKLDKKRTLGLVESYREKKKNYKRLWEDLQHKHEDLSKKYEKEREKWKKTSINFEGGMSPIKRQVKSRPTQEKKKTEEKVDIFYEYLMFNSKDTQTDVKSQDFTVQTNLSPRDTDRRNLQKRNVTYAQDRPIVSELRHDYEPKARFGSKEPVKSERVSPIFASIFSSLKKKSPPKKLTSNTLLVDSIKSLIRKAEKHEEPLENSYEDNKSDDIIEEIPSDLDQVSWKTGYHVGFQKGQEVGEEKKFSFKKSRTPKNAQQKNSRRFSLLSSFIKNDKQMIKEFQLPNSKDIRLPTMGERILINIINRPLNKKKATMTKKMVLKCISSVYLCTKSDDVIENLYEEFYSKYGLKNASIKKTREFLTSAIVFKEVKRIETFLRVIAASEKIGLSRFSQHTTRMIISIWKYMFTSKLGIIVSLDESSETILFPIVRGMECVREKLEGLLPKEEYYDVICLVESSSINDTHKINPAGMIDIDGFIDILIQAYEIYQESIRSGVILLSTILGYSPEVPVCKEEFGMILDLISPSKADFIEEFSDLEVFTVEKIIDKAIAINCLSMNEIKVFFPLGEIDLENIEYEICEALNDAKDFKYYHRIKGVYNHMNTGNAYALALGWKIYQSKLNMSNS